MAQEAPPPHGWGVLLLPGLGYALAHSRARGADLLLLAALLACADHRREVRASVSDLGNMARVPYPTAMRSLRHLTRTGEVAVVAAARGRTPRRYRIVVGSEAGAA